jgi:RNA polymerase sigma factor (TIGR02999 family)
MTRNVTELIHAADAGDPQAAAELIPLVYGELRKLAAFHLAGQPPGQTLQPTALVHEAWLRISGENHPWEGRKHFVSAAAEAMRRILVDQARRKLRLKRGGDMQRVEIGAMDIAMETPPDVLLRVDDALGKLAMEDPVKAELIKLRFFVGLGIPAAAEALGISPATAKRHWSYARAWLYAELRKTP